MCGTDILERLRDCTARSPVLWLRPRLQLFDLAGRVVARRDDVEIETMMDADTYASAVAANGHSDIRMPKPGSRTV